jgi:hypothetical protein
MKVESMRINFISSLPALQTRWRPAIRPCDRASMAFGGDRLPANARSALRLSRRTVLCVPLGVRPPVLEAGAANMGMGITHRHQAWPSGYPGTIEPCAWSIPALPHALPVRIRLIGPGPDEAVSTLRSASERR